MGRGISRDGCVSTRAPGSYSVRMLGVVISFLRLVKALSCVGIQSQAFFALNSSRNGLDKSAMLERICQVGLPSQGICGVLKQISVFHLLYGSSFVGVSSYASLINDMSQDRKTGLGKFTFSTVKCEERDFSTAWS